MVIVVAHHSSLITFVAVGPLFIYIFVAVVFGVPGTGTIRMPKFSHGQSSTDRIHNHISSSIGLPVHQSCWTIHPVPIMSHKILQSRVLLSYFAINWMQNLHRLLSSKFASIVIVKICIDCYRHIVTNNPIHCTSSGMISDVNL